MAYVWTVESWELRFLTFELVFFNSLSHSLILNAQ